MSDLVICSCCGAELCYCACTETERLEYENSQLRTALSAAEQCADEAEKKAEALRNCWNCVNGNTGLKYKGHCGYWLRGDCNHDPEHPKYLANWAPRNPEGGE